MFVRQATVDEASLGPPARDVVADGVLHLAVEEAVEAAEAEASDAKEEVEEAAEGEKE